jgi:hypothetical protein
MLDQRENLTTINELNLRNIRNLNTKSYFIVVLAGVYPLLCSSTSCTNIDSLVVIVDPCVLVSVGRRRAVANKFSQSNRTVKINIKFIVVSGGIGVVTEKDSC